MEVYFQPKDVEKLIPIILKEIREEVERDKFISYPRGLQEYLGGASYKKVNGMWNKPDFPRIDKDVKGVWLNELKQYLK